MTVRDEVITQGDALHYQGMKPCAIYLDPKSYTMLMQDCTPNEVYDGKFRGVPIYTVHAVGSPVIETHRYVRGRKC